MTLRPASVHTISDARNARPRTRTASDAILSMCPKERNRYRLSEAAGIGKTTVALAVAARMAKTIEHDVGLSISRCDPILGFECRVRCGHNRSRRAFGR